MRGCQQDSSFWEDLAGGAERKGERKERRETGEQEDLKVWPQNKYEEGQLQLMLQRCEG